MSSSLIILIGFIISATLMTIIWLGLKYNQKKRRAQAEIEKQKVDILSRIEEAVSNVSTANEPDRRRLPSDQQYGLPTWGKYLLVLTWLPFIASLVFAGVHSQNKNLKPSTTSNITTIISSSTTQPKATVSTTASATTGNVTVYSTTPSKPNTTPISTTSVPAATLIQYGQTVTGQIAFSNDYQNWQFTGQAGDVITIQMVQDGGASLKPEVELFDPSGARVSYNWGGNGYTEADITNYKLADSGSYIIRAETTEGYPATIGGYKVSLNKK